MLAIARFSVPLATSGAFAGQIEQAHQALSQCEGYIDGEAGQNLDEPTLWVLMTRWRNVGSYRRALSSARVKMQAIPLLAQALDEPGAYQRQDS
ncbi:MAG: antibiotic biosynthesis monooxygenase [Candidatus Planktophila sp.]|nr:antibiotic biosynthesis monooxygenase [Candidatus Planktophila sp.]